MSRQATPGNWPSWWGARSPRSAGGSWDAHGRCLAVVDGLTTSGATRTCRSGATSSSPRPFFGRANMCARRRSFRAVGGLPASTRLQRLPDRNRHDPYGTSSLRGPPQPRSPTCLFRWSPLFRYRRFLPTWECQVERREWCQVDNGLGVAWAAADDRRAYHDRLRLTTRRSALTGGVVLLIAFPMWSVFDLLVLPARAPAFIAIRATFEVPIALAVLALWRPKIGGRWPEQTAFVLLVLPQLAIAWMVPRSQPQLAAYLLGFSLVIFGSAVVVVWRWPLTAWLTAVSLAATAVSAVTSRSVLSKASVATIVFYLGTAGVVAVVGQLYRYRSGWEQFVTEAALQRERRRNAVLMEELEKLSREDPLTGVANRRAWEAWAHREHHRAERSRSPFSIVLCDFDRFKDVNDLYGHAFGDEVLRAGAEALQAGSRSIDFVARLGGDEFIVGCPDTDLAAATELANRLADAARTLSWPHEVLMTLSFGVAQLSPNNEDMLALLARADTALYQAKISRDTVVFAASSTSP
jgi:diguanylate cyclase (GGDEF)-like protein